MSTRQKALWSLLALALIVTPAVVGLLVINGGSESRSKGALVAEGTGAGYELTIAPITKSGEAIDVVSYGWGVNVPGAVAGGTATGKAQFRNLVISKKLDGTSPLFVKGAVTNTMYPTVVLKLYKGSGGKPAAYATYTLTRAYVVRVDHGGTADNLPTEEIEFSYQKLAIEGGTLDTSTGEVGPPSQFSYDLATAKA
jgi:type VI secretion system secreted protein Hcp